MTVIVPPVPAPAGAGALAPQVLGLDLALTCTGVALPDGSTYRLRTRPREGDRRLLVIRDEIRAVLNKYAVDLVVLEDLPWAAHGAGVTAMVHGVVKVELLAADVPYALIAPATLKSYACDNGRAEKDWMAAAAFLHAGVEFADDRGGDQCDAWWLRAAGLDWYGHPLVALPAAQRERLHKAKWPLGVVL